ncbi:MULTISPECIES: phospholipase D-like domain-containing protein [unclassified Nocardioides]|uniref:phospholipase D-like domain-containing protein n=1 Tax=unclassified Nocardioides TaxID=2615069 RepID=UPI0006F36A8F|nr:MULTISPECIES: phospholipase D-like domain-containing protein [unclassified Nocardioides]KQY64132.1 phospholipase [Nocardioides sp. Root140]KQZ70052.1 phospholipase [Nocardioides sp. Root151]KRF16150.1 phospholipase [Nocardioides sp. Soil796]
MPRTDSSRARLLTLVRRTLLSFFGVQVLLAIGLTLVDSYRRRNKKPKPFPTTTPETVEVGDGTVTTYTFGQDLYDDMLAAIAGAKRQILFETYIWKGDEVGERFKQALTDAADRGVDVHIIYDAFANIVVKPTFKKFSPSLKVLRFPVYNAGLRFFDLRHYGRDHRKILVVDDEVGFVGGYNIGTPYATEWRDTHCRITGPGVWDLKRAFADFWNLYRRKRFRASERPLLLETASQWEPRIRFQRNVPRLWMFPIRSMYLEAINRATGNIWLTHAYFIPDQDFVDALADAARRGVDVRLLVPAKSNHIVADWISRGYFGQLIAAGVRIFRFKDAMVHAKTATIDGSWSTIGTANIDRLSMQGNYEINVEIIDPGMAHAMEQIYEVDLSNSAELTRDEWESRDIYRRFTEAVLAPLRPLL